MQIRQRIAHIQDDGHFGVHKDVFDDVWELRWNNGRRIYYAYIPEKKSCYSLEEINMSRSKSKRIVKLRKDTGIRASNPREELLDEQLIGRAVWECLKEGDSEGVIEVIAAYLEAVNKTEIARRSEVARSTMYHTLKSKNPTIKTLAKLVHACI